VPRLAAVISQRLSILAVRLPPAGTLGWDGGRHRQVVRRISSDSAGDLRWLAEVSGNSSITKVRLGLAN
jgi:hypothetical protein